jgi:hypothetical protein
MPVRSFMHPGMHAWNMDDECLHLKRRVAEGGLGSSLSSARNPAKHL